MTTSVRIYPEQIENDSIVPGLGPRSAIRPWTRTLPRLLYKYYPPERLHVLTDGMVRFSQRQVFDDRLDLRPEVANFGTEDEMRAFMDLDPVLNQHSSSLKDAVIRHVLDTPGRQAELIHQAQQWMKAPEEFGVFCVCENSRSVKMWEEYAADGTGFVVAFNTQCRAFNKLRFPGLIGKVEYSDEKVRSFLSAYGAAAFFLKRQQYAFEAEWRSIRALKRFDHILNNGSGEPIYLSEFDASSIAVILILETCAVEWELRTLVAIDCRYRHVKVEQFASSTLT